MNENNTASTQTETVVDDWDDIDLGDVADDGDDSSEDNPADTETQTKVTGTETETSADHSEGKGTEEPTATQTETKEKAEADHSFRLKYMGEEKEYSRDEMVAFAQKGIDYDRIKGKLDEHVEAAEFVKLLAEEAGQTVADFMDNARAGVIAKKEGISQTEAMSKLQLQRREAELAAREKALEEKNKAAETAQTEEQRVREDFISFFKTRPDVKADSIPKEVVAKAISQKLPLLTVYQAYENEKLRAELETERQNTKNKERSVGSAETSGKRTPADEFDAAWYDGT